MVWRDSDHGIQIPWMLENLWIIGNPLIGICPNEGCLFSEEKEVGKAYLYCWWRHLPQSTHCLTCNCRQICSFGIQSMGKVSIIEESEIAQKHNCRTLCLRWRLRPPDLIIQMNYIFSLALGTTARLIESTMDVLWVTVTNRSMWQQQQRFEEQTKMSNSCMVETWMSFTSCRSNWQFLAREDRDSPDEVHIHPRSTQQSKNSSQSTHGISFATLRTSLHSQICQTTCRPLPHLGSIFQQSTWVRWCASILAQELRRIDSTFCRRIRISASWIDGTKGTDVAPNLERIKRGQVCIEAFDWTRSLCRYRGYDKHVPSRYWYSSTGFDGHCWSTKEQFRVHTIEWSSRSEKKVL